MCLTLVSVRPSIKNVLLSVLSGLLIVPAFPLAISSSQLNPGGIGSFLAWFFLVPLLFVLKNTTSKKQSFFYGSITGFVFYLGTMFWIVIAVHVYGYVPLPSSILITIALIFYTSLYLGLFAIIYKFFLNYSPRLWIMAPVIYTALEFLRSHLFTGFPWSNIAYTQYANIHLIQIVDVTGVYGLCFLIYLVNVVLFKLFSTRIKIRTILPCAILIVLVVAYGYYRVDRINPSDTRNLKVALLQGNIPQDEKWLMRNTKRIIETYHQLTLEADQTGVDLIVWPEASVPRYFFGNMTELPSWLKFDEPLHAYLFLGHLTIDLESPERRQYNSASLFSPDLSLIDMYHKSHLVPFGEYVPLADIIPFGALTAQSGRFYEGRSFRTLNTDKAQLGALICYESIFPEISRRFVRNGANVLVNITNDAWFDRTSALYQHFAFAIFRAVENKVPVVRAANTGISGIIDSYGRVKSRTGDFVEAILYGDVDIEPNHQLTIYAKYGDIFAFANVGILIVVSGIVLIKRRKNNTRTAH